jgi:acylglycerol lipase
VSARIPAPRRAAFALALAAALMMTSCAQPKVSPPLSLGPALCQEGPPSWEASDGRRLMYRSWRPRHGKIRAIVVAVPGWNGTAGDIGPLGRSLASHGIAVYSTGVRGQHGDLTAASQGLKGHVDDWRLWARDFSEFTGTIHKRYPQAPLFLYGQSMGSLTALLVAFEETRSGQFRVSGIILHSPAVALMYASPLLRLCVAELRRLKPRGLLFRVGLIPGDKPALTNSVEFDRFWGLSRDRVRPGYTWSFFDEALRMGTRARSAAAQIDIPVIVLTGDNDPIGTAGVGQGAFARLMRRLPTEAKERRRFPNGYHDLIHDSNKSQALRDVSAWLDQRLRADGAGR